jgi:hypothetical protein
MGIAAGVLVMGAAVTAVYPLDSGIATHNPFKPKEEVSATMDELRPIVHRPAKTWVRLLGYRFPQGPQV